jgi:hypothetical protein
VCEREMVESVLGRHGLGPALGGQDLDQRLVEPELLPLDEPKRRRRGDHLRDRSNPEARLVRDRDAVAAMGNAAGVLEEGPPSRQTTVTPLKSWTATR